MRPRRAKLLSLIGLVRLMVLALALQLSGSAPVLARVAEAVREQVAPPHACPCCLASAASERTVDRSRDRVGAADQGCCRDLVAGAGCADRCTGCGSARDSKSFTSQEPLAIALAESVGRVAAPAPAEAEPPFVQGARIYRPPCA